MTSRPVTVPPTISITGTSVVRRSFCALDEASYHLDSASAPWSVHLEVRVTGSVVEGRLRHAVGAALAGHPRAHARLTTGRGDRVEWEITPEPDVDPLDVVVCPEQVQIPVPSGRGGQLRALVGELRQAAPRSAHLVPIGGADRPGYQLHHLVLDTAQTAALAARAKAGTTVNDLLLAGLHLALDSWNSGHGGAAGRLSVLMPVNLRPKASWHEVFGNFSFMVPVVTRPADRAEPTATVESIRRRTQHIKRQCTPAAAVRFLDVLQHLPLPAKQGIARLAASERVIPTAILSNLGRLEEDLDFGPELRASEVWFSPPVRMPMGLAVGALTSAGRLHLVLRYRHPLFGPADIVDFADSYRAALGHLAVGSHVGSSR